MLKLISAERTAEMLDEKIDAVYRFAREGILPCVRIGRKVKFSEKVLEEFIKTGGKALPGGWRREA